MAMMMCDAPSAFALDPTGRDHKKRCRDSSRSPSGSFADVVFEKWRVAVDSGIFPDGQTMNLNWGTSPPFEYTQALRKCAADLPPGCVSDVTDSMWTFEPRTVEEFHAFDAVMRAHIWPGAPPGLPMTLACLTTFVSYLCERYCAADEEGLFVVMTRLFGLPLSRADMRSCSGASVPTSQRSIARSGS